MIAELESIVADLKEGHAIYVAEIEAMQNALAKMQADCDLLAAEIITRLKTCEKIANATIEAQRKVAGIVEAIKAKRDPADWWKDRKTDS